MRQTIIKEGLQARLPALIGDESSTYSVEVSLLEDITRVCSALVGNSQYGIVMAGMNMSISGGVQVGPGYGITPSGKIIKLAKIITSAESISPAINTSYNVYVNYIEALRNDSQGGKTLPVVRGTTPVSIIKDQIGATTAIESDTAGVVTYETGNVATAQDRVYVGTIIVDGVGGIFYSYPKLESKNTILKENASGPLLASGGTSTSTAFATNSMVSLAEGNNYLRSIQMILKGPMTNALRTGVTASDYYVHMDVVGSDISGTPTTMTSFVLNDTVGNYSRQTFQINQSLSTSISEIFLNPWTVTVGAFATSTVPCSVSYIIEKLN